MSLFAPAFVLFGLAVLAALLPVRRVAVAGAWALLTAGCVLIAIVGISGVAAGHPVALAAFALPLIGAFGFEVTPLGALFLLVTACVFALALPFQLRDSAAYAPTRRTTFVGLIALTLAAMLALFTAADVASFVFAWEVAALGIWALVGFETRRAEPVAAGLLTIALSEAGSLAGLAGLLLLAFAAGTAHLDGIAAAAPTLPGALVVAGCVLTFFGFGMKAGVIPLNLWLPAAHGAAPRSISPILSGATLNLGLYAFLRLDAPLARTDARLGLMILATGAATALIGIMYALIEDDLKRLLAQSSIENIGIATAGFGAGFAFAALGHPVLGGLALVAGLYHTINHSAYKTPMFLGAGGIDAAVGTHDLNVMGGLLRRLPLLGTLLVIGAFSIAALPPLNGFVSEWMLLQSLLRVVEIGSVPVRVVFALAGAALALTAGLAVTCFAMVVASGLLGLPRSRAAAAAHAAPRTVWAPMAVLAAVCLALGVLATAVIPVLGRIAAPLVGADPTAALVPSFFGHVQVLKPSLVAGLDALGAAIGRGLLPLRGLVVLNDGGVAGNVAYAMSTALIGVALALLLFLTWLATRPSRQRRRLDRRVLWDAGLVHLRPEMTYTATAFAAPARVLFHTVFQPDVSATEQHQGAFLTRSRRHEATLNLMERLVVHPAAVASQWVAALLARAHRGPVTAYAGYVLVALLAVLLATRWMIN